MFLGLFLIFSAHLPQPCNVNIDGGFRCYKSLDSSINQKFKQYH